MSPITDGIRAAISARHDLMKEAFASGDPDLIANHYYTKDAWVFGDQDQTWKGSDAIRELYAGVVGTYTWTSKSERIVPMGDGAIEYVIGAIHPVDDAEPTSYKIVFGWVKQGDEWLCNTQMFGFGTHF